MSHHSNSGMIPEDFMKQLGATGQFPNGKIDENDEGEIKIAIGSKSGTVFIEFGTSVRWIGFTPQQARQVAATIIEHANMAYEIGHSVEAMEVCEATNKQK